MTPPSPKEIREAIAIVTDSRQTHVWWIEHYAKGHPLDETAGDTKWHEVCVRGYDKVLSVLGRLQ